jgi:hypothetical protein
MPRYYCREAEAILPEFGCRMALGCEEMQRPQTRGRNSFEEAKCWEKKGEKQLTHGALPLRLIRPPTPSASTDYRNGHETTHHVDTLRLSAGDAGVFVLRIKTAR